MDEESRTSRNSRLRNLNEEQFVSLGHSFDQRKPWKRKKKRERRERKSRTEDGHRYPLFHGEDRLSPYLPRRQPIPKIEFTRSAFESGTCLLNRETFLSAQESGNWLRFRSRSSRHRQPPSLFPRLAEFLGRISGANKPARREGTRRSGAEGRQVWKLSVSWLPSNRFACFSRKWDKRR